MTKINRRRGALIGLAVGDALGAAVEFMSPGSFVPFMMLTTLRKPFSRL